MVIKKFKLRAREHKQFFTVIIYNSLKHLRSDGDKHDKRGGVLQPDNSEVVGLCHSFIYHKIFPDGTKKPMPRIGIIRLYKKAMGGGVLAHEVLHAAFWQYRLSLPDEMADFGKECSPKEEDFAHLFTELLRDAHNKMYKHKLWT